MSLSWAASCPERRGDSARLQASESVLGSLLSGEAWRGPVWLQASESALCSLLSGEVQCGCRRVCQADYSLRMTAGCQNALLLFWLLAGLVCLWLGTQSVGVSC